MTTWPPPPSGQADKRNQGSSPSFGGFRSFWNGYLRPLRESAVCGQSFGGGSYAEFRTMPLLGASVFAAWFCFIFSFSTARFWGRAKMP